MSGKRYAESVKQVVEGKRYAMQEALATLRRFKPAKFDETVDLSVSLGIDPKKTEQMVRGTFSLPKGLGRKVRIVVFAAPDKAEKARAAGAEEVGGDDLIKKVADGWMDFDIAISTPDMMGKVGRLGRVLGPQGKMPSPKSGTVTENVENAVKEFKAGKVEYRNDETGNLHIPVGKCSFKDEDLAANIGAVLDHIVSIRPSAVKGRFVRKAVLSSTMSPGILLETRE